MGPNYVSAEKAYTDRVIELLTLRVGMINYLNTEVSRERLTPGSWGAMLYEAVDRGEITEVAVPKLLVDYVGPALDTTISAIGSMVWLFAQNPVQWDRLRKNPALISAAIIEAVRLEPPLQWFSRVVVEDQLIDGVMLAKNSRVLLLYASANRDERKYLSPDEFDIGRNANDHLGWGYGVHACIGQSLARLEMTAILKALLLRVAKIELAGTPSRKINTALRAFKHLPVRVIH